MLPLVLNAKRAGRIRGRHADRFVQRHSTCCTIVRTRSIMRAALPASAERSASQQTPSCDHAIDRPKSENVDSFGKPAPAVASVTRQIPAATFRAIKHFISVVET